MILTASATSAGRGLASPAARCVLLVVASSDATERASADAVLLVAGVGAGAGVADSAANGFTFDIPYTEAVATAAGVAESAARGVALHAADPAAPPVALVVEALPRVTLASTASRRADLPALVTRSVVEVVHADPGQ